MVLELRPAGRRPGAGVKSGLLAVRVGPDDIPRFVLACWRGRGVEKACVCWVITQVLAVAGPRQSWEPQAEPRPPHVDGRYPVAWATCCPAGL